MKSNRKQFQGKAIAFVLRVIQWWLLRKSPKGVEKFGKRVGRLIWRLGKRRRLTCESNLSMAFPELSEEEVRSLSKRVFENFGRSSADFLVGINHTLEQLEATTTINGFENFETAMAKGKGVLLITGHFGNWERMSSIMSLRGYKLSVIARDANDQGVNQLVNNLRKGPGTEVIARGDAARPMLQKLRAGEMIGILPDQNSNECFIPFFGKPAGTVLGPGVISERTGCAVLPCFCHYVGDGKYEINIYPELTAQEGFETKGEGMMRAINAKLEEVIREHPDQWLWFHDRWRNARKKGLL